MTHVIGRSPSTTRTTAALAHAGFERAWETELRREVAMSRDALVQYLMTHSERIAAIREGLETESEQQRFLAEGIAPFYDNVVARRVAFGIQIEGYRRLSNAVRYGTTPAGSRVDAAPSRPKSDAIVDEAVDAAP